jgi:hypothetical protein
MKNNNLVNKPKTGSPIFLKLEGAFSVLVMILTGFGLLAVKDPA